MKREVTQSLSEFISLRDAMKLLNPPRHVATAYRWALRGCRGQKLRTYLVGGTRVTTVADLERFVADVTAAGASSGNASTAGQMSDAG